MRRILALGTAFTLISTFTIGSQVLAASNEWRPIGSAITNDSDSVFTGVRVDMDDAGDTFAVVSINISDVDEPRQEVTVYDWSAATRDWEIRGEPVTNSFEFDPGMDAYLIVAVLGAAIDLSGDGNSLAVASPISTPDSPSTGVGRVAVYDWSGDGWEERGTIPTPDSALVFGWSMALSDDGDTVVVGSLDTDCSEFLGNVRVFDWVGTWTERTGLVPCEGDSPVPGIVGSSVAVSDDGNTIAFSALIAAGEGVGAVVVRKWNTVLEPDSWSAFSGFATDEASIFSLPSGIEMSDDGTSLAVSSLSFGGPTGVKVGVFDEVGGEWTQRGEDLLGDAVPLGSVMSEALRILDTTSSTLTVPTLAGPTLDPIDWGDWVDSGIFVYFLLYFIFGQIFGATVDIDGDGSTIAVNDLFLAADVPGGLSIYDWRGASWERRGPAIDPNDSEADSRVALSVAINANGTRVVSGQVNGEILSGDSADSRARVYGWLRGTSSTQYKVSVSFDPAGGTCNDKTTPWTVTKRGAINLPTAEQCTRPGHALLGWTTNPTRTAPEELLHTVIARPGTLTAVWGPVPPAPTGVTAITNFGCDNCGTTLLAWQQPASNTTVTNFQVTVDNTPVDCPAVAWADWWACTITTIDPNTPHTYTVRAVGENGVGDSASVSTT